jgi:hypothetical protein
MWSGVEALSTIDQSLHSLRRQLQEVDEQVQTASRKLVEVRQSEARRFLELAKTRWDRLAGGDVSASLDDTDRQVHAMLAARDEELQQLEKKLVENDQLEARLESQRQEQRRRVNELSQSLDVAEARAQDRLQQDAGYLGALEEARHADAVAREAEAKTEQAEADRKAKGAPYEADPLFMYLWRRRYGTAEYKASALTRFLDGWVARLCRFHDARPNYWMLLEIPLRLREHANRVRQEAQLKIDAVSQQEAAAAEAEGAPKIESDLREVEEALRRLDTQIAEAEQAYASLVEQRAAYAAGNDETLKQCLESLARQLEREPLPSLRRHAASTPGAHDDALVHDLADLDAREDELAAALERHRQLFQRHLDRVKELEDVRRKFKDHDYDGFGSIFANEALITMMLNQFLRGMASGGDFWGTVRGNHRRRRGASNPTFGSGGFGLPTGGWRMPRFPSGGGGGGASRGGGLGGGGFKTTGGF